MRLLSSGPNVNLWRDTVPADGCHRSRKLPFPSLSCQHDSLPFINSHRYQKLLGRGHGLGCRTGITRVRAYGLRFRTQHRHRWAEIRPMTEENLVRFPAAKRNAYLTPRQDHLVSWEQAHRGRKDGGRSVRQGRHQ